MLWKVFLFGRRATKTCLLAGLIHSIFTKKLGLQTTWHNLWRWLWWAGFSILFLLFLTGRNGAEHRFTNFWIGICILLQKLNICGPSKMAEESWFWPKKLIPPYWLQVTLVKATDCLLYRAFGLPSKLSPPPGLAVGLIVQKRVRNQSEISPKSAYLDLRQP